MRSFKAFLAVVIAGAVLPGVLFGGAASYWLAVEMRLAAEQEAQILAERMADDVADHVRLVTAAMKALAASPAITGGDLPEAYRFAASLGGDLGQHIGLATPDGEQLFNTRRPLGTPLPRRAEATSYRRALATGQPSVSDIIIGAVAQRPLITIDLPVHTKHGLRVLGTSTDLALIGAVLERTTLKPGWKSAILDGEGRFIARSLAADQYEGKPAVPELVAAVKSGQTNGTFRSRSHEGEPVVQFFRRVPGTGWTAAITTPEPLLLAPLTGPLLALAATGATAIGLTLGVAALLGRRLNAAARRLTAAAGALGHGAPLPPLSQSIAEFEDVEMVLHDAARRAREREADLAAAREAAERSLAVKNRFIATTSHDLRQPLQTLAWCIELLGPLTAGSDKATRCVAILAKAHAAMTDLVEALFEIGKLDADGVRPQPAEVDLAVLVAAIVEECSPAAAAKGLRLTVRPLRNCSVTTDAKLLGRLLRNLVHNAIRYTAAGGVLVGLRRRQRAVWIEVWDTGIGIPADKLDLIWEEFYQVDSGAEARGTGLGLAIVARLAAVLDCRVEVRSRPGKGSVFRVMLPG